MAVNRQKYDSKVLTKHASLYIPQVIKTSSFGNETLTEQVLNFKDIYEQEQDTDSEKEDFGETRSNLKSNENNLARDKSSDMPIDESRWQLQPVRNIDFVSYEFDCKENASKQSSNGKSPQLKPLPKINEMASLGVSPRREKSDRSRQSSDELVTSQKKSVVLSRLGETRNIKSKRSARSTFSKQINTKPTSQDSKRGETPMITPVVWPIYNHEGQTIEGGLNSRAGSMFPMQAYSDHNNLFASLVGQSNKRSVLSQKKIDQWLQTRSKSINTS